MRSAITRATCRPASISATAIAIDTRDHGSDLQRDRLCVVQLSAGDGTVHLVHFPDRNYAAPNLRAGAVRSQESQALSFRPLRPGDDPAPFRHRLPPVYCTRTASRLVRTNTDRHGLKDLCRELLGVELSKQQQTSDWGADT